MRVLFGPNVETMQLLLKISSSHGVSSIMVGSLVEFLDSVGVLIISSTDSGDGVWDFSSDG